MSSKDKKKLPTMSELLKRARRSGLKGLAKDVEKQIAVLQNKYVDLAYLTQVVEEGNVKLIQGEYVSSDEVSRFPRQQDVPGDAGWSPSQFARELRLLAVVAISYCWLHKAHPDPEGRYLKIIRRAMSLRLAWIGPGQVNGVALFFDFMSIAQEPRTPEEKASFIEGLHEVNILYANQQVEVWVLQWVPPGIPRTYDDRAWPTFEKCAASLIKDSNQLITLAAEVDDCTSWVDVFAQRPRRTPPYTPTAFDSLIDTKSVTNGKDVQLLKKKYRETFDDVVSNAPCLWFANLGWDESDAAVLAEVLPFCKGLEAIILSGNLFTKAEARLLIEAAASNLALQTLDLKSNPIPYIEHENLKDAWQQAGKSRDRLLLGSPQEAANITRPVIIGQGTSAWATGDGIA